MAAGRDAANIRDCSEDIGPLQRLQGVAIAVRLTMTAQVEGEDAVALLYNHFCLPQQPAVGSLRWINA